MPFSRQFLLSLLIICAAVGPSFSASAELAPDWTLSTPDGQAVNLAIEASEQTTVLLFWATWCPYCKALMPHLQSIRLEYGEEVKVLAINIFEDADPVEFIATAGYDFTLLLDGDAVAGQYEVGGTPAVFVVDQDREIRFDLRKLPRIDPPDNGKKVTNPRRAAFLAPYWAAEIRKSIDKVREDAN